MFLYTQKYKKCLIIARNLLIFIKMKEKKYKKISISIDKKFQEKLDSVFTNKSRFINNLIKERIKKEKS